ncbi:MAG: hypothetical protein A4E23_00679 [Methanomethylovorans sp. PtaU1.Bin073]|nr:MAG: hypothetical protein A4E23_00679 [Methanomethylovorans sp. PtaU1.Bin073]
MSPIISGLPPRLVDSTNMIQNLCIRWLPVFAEKNSHDLNLSILVLSLLYSSFTSFVSGPKSWIRNAFKASSITPPLAPAELPSDRIKAGKFSSLRLILFSIFLHTFPVYTRGVMQIAIAIGMTIFP